MTEYSGIRGTRVKYLSSDPTLNTSTEGQVWYNSTEGTLKSLVQIKAWSAGGNMGTARYGLGGTGTQTAALGAGGYSGTYKNETEEYNGTSWTAGGNLTIAKSYSMGSGTQTAALSSGGATPTYPYSPVTDVQGYDGTAWSTRPSLATSRGKGGGSGTQTAGLTFGGTTDNGSTFTAATEEFTGEIISANIKTLTTG